MSHLSRGVLAHGGGRGAVEVGAEAAVPLMIESQRCLGSRVF